MATAPAAETEELQGANTLGEILAASEKQTKHEDDAPGLTVEDPRGGPVPDHVCGGGALLSPRWAAQLDDRIPSPPAAAQASVAASSRVAPVPAEDSSSSSSDEDEEVPRARIQVYAARQDQQQQLLSAEFEEFEEQMADFERECSKMHISEPPAPVHHAVHAAYAELYNAVPLDMVFRMKAAMREIPEGVPGLQDCEAYLSHKQHYTLQDMLVCQYILNGGILMRQRHNTASEHHVDLSAD